MSAPRARRAGVVIAVLIGGVIVLNLLAQGLDRAVGGNEPGGVNDHSYATAGNGVAAYASLLSRYGHRVTQQRGALSRLQVGSVDTVIVLGPDVVAKDDATVLLDFVSNGGRLVIGDRAPPYLHELRDSPPRWSGGRVSLWTRIDPTLGNVRSIAAADGGRWVATGSGRALVGDDTDALVTTDRIGRGEILFLADPTPLENAYLVTADNAAFGLALAGPRHSIVFAEGVHGFGSSRGIDAIPSRWKFALGMLALGMLAFVLARARRFGPPDRAARDLPPARAEYVRALSLTLERTRDPAHALAPVQLWTRDRVTARAALRPDASDEEIARAAKALGCSDRDVAVLLAPVTNNDDALALGRVLARISGGSDSDGRIG